MQSAIDYIRFNQKILDEVDNAVLVVDQQARVIYMNKMAETILGQTLASCQHHHIASIYAQTGLPRVLASAEAEHNLRADINGSHCVVTRIPLVEDGQVIGAFALFADVTTIDDLSEALSQERAEISILKMILEIAYDGIVVVDSEAKITMISSAYKKFLDLEDSDVIGRPITDIIENTRMHIVLETGVPEINELQLIKGNYMVATRIPYYVNGKLAGAVGKVIFRNVKEINDIHKKLELIQRELSDYKSAFSNIYQAKYTLDQIISHDAQMLRLKQNVHKIAKSEVTVLLTGESGTGKELFAHAIHAESDRAKYPFVVMNCAAIPEQLLESELFGYERGAFTGATKDGHMGKFELANHGTLFLDEIGDMPLNMQAKILRVLQEGEIERLGGSYPIAVNVRMLAATNRNLGQMVAAGTFREDLYYRLNVFNFDIPPLNARKGDIPLIADHLLDVMNNHYHKQIKGLSRDALHTFYDYDWPGNVRELKNVIERAYTIVEGSDYIDVHHLPQNFRQDVVADDAPLKSLVEDAERLAIKTRLAAFHGNKTKTAKSLHISRVALHKKIEKYQLV